MQFQLKCLHIVKQITHLIMAGLLSLLADILEHCTLQIVLFTLNASACGMLTVTASASRTPMLWLHVQHLSSLVVQYSSYH